MRIGFGLAVGSVVAISTVIACTEDTTTPANSSSGSSGASSSGSSGTSSSSGSSGTSSSSGSSGSSADACAIAPGTYTTKYTTKPGGTGPAGGACTDIPASEIEIKPSTGDGGTAEPAEGCTQTIDKAACKVTTVCETKASGYTTKSTTETTTKDGAVKGSTSNKTTKDDDNSVLSDCSYDFEWTKK